MQYSLKELRARLNETQADVAKAMGISLSTYHYWESNILNVNYGNVLKLADHFGVSVEEIKAE